MIAAGFREDLNAALYTEAFLVEFRLLEALAIAETYAGPCDGLPRAS